MGSRRQGRVLKPVSGLMLIVLGNYLLIDRCAASIGFTAVQSKRTFAPVDRFVSEALGIHGTAVAFIGATLRGGNMKKIVAMGMLSLLPLFAGAAPIEITVEGQVTLSSDSSGAAFGLGAGANTVLGRTITFQWLVDPARAPTPTGTPTRWFDCPDSGVGGVDWIGGATVSIDGVGRIDLGTIAAPTNSCDGVALGDGIFGNRDGTLLTGTSFQLLSFDQFLSEDNSYYTLSSSTLVLYSDTGLPSDLLGLDDLGLLPTTGVSGRGSISRFDQCFGGPEQCPAGRFSFFANYELTSLSVRTVPEPGSLALVAAAAIAGAWICRRRRTGVVG